MCCGRLCVVDRRVATVISRCVFRVRVVLLFLGRRWVVNCIPSRGLLCGLCFFCDFVESHHVSDQSMSPARFGGYSVCLAGLSPWRRRMHPFHSGGRINAGFCYSSWNNGTHMYSIVYVSYSGDPPERHSISFENLSQTVTPRSKILQSLDIRRRSRSFREIFHNSVVSVRYEVKNPCRVSVGCYPP